MSLIDEALKRARMEAAHRAAEGEGLPYPTIPRHLGPPRRRGWLALAVLLLVVVLLAGLVGGWLLASRRPGGEQLAAGNTSAVAPPAAAEAAPPTAPLGDPTAGPAAARPEDMATSAAQSPGPGVPPVSDPQEELTAPPPVPAGSSPTAATEGRPAAQPGVSPPRPLSAGGSGRRPIGAAPTPVQESPPPPSPAAAEPGPAPRSPSATAVTDPDSGMLLVLPERPEADSAASGSPADGSQNLVLEHFIQRYPLPDGGNLDLGGIAWSENGPFALLNGRVVGPGSAIEGHTLEQIKPGHVVLVGDGRRILLSLQ